MKDIVVLQDKTYISAKRVQQIFGYTSDYIGQLCRAGKLDATMVGRAWFVTEKSVSDYKAGVKTNFNKPKKVKIFPQTTKIQQAPVIETIKDEVKLPEKKEEPIVSPIQNIQEEYQVLKYESESAPFIPELKKRTILLTSQGSTIFAPATFATPLAQGMFSSVVSHAQENDVPEVSRSSIKKVSLALLVVVIFFTSFKTLTLSPYYEIVKNTVYENTEVVTASLSSVTHEIIDSIGSGFSHITLAISQMTHKKTLSINSEVNNSMVAENPSGVQVSGIAVAPSTNSEEGDKELVETIKSSFSDEVRVRVHEDGTSGVITPVFKKAKGDDFVYVLVPVKPTTVKNQK